MDRMIWSSLFLYRLSCKTFLMATVSPVSRHLAYMYMQQKKNQCNYRKKNSGRKKYAQKQTSLYLENDSEWSSSHNSLGHVADSLRSTKAYNQS